MEFGFSDLFANEQTLFALSAVICAVATAAGLRLYRRDFHQLTDGETDMSVLAAVCVAGAACGLYFAGAEAIAGLLALLQSALVCVYIIRDLRRLASHNKIELRRQSREVADLTQQLKGYMTAFQDQAARLAEAEPAAKLLARMRVVADNISPGVALFDAQERLVYCNTRFASIHDLPRELAREGVSYDAILARRIANGEFPGQTLESAESWRRGDLARRKEISVLTQRDDGRSLETTLKILPNGERLATFHDVTDVRIAVSKAVQGGLSDTLTGLPTKTSFLGHLDAALARMWRLGSPLAVLMIDIDHFKGVNDSLGLEIGDKLLQLVAERLRDLLRTTDVIARLEGDRFAVLADTLSEDVDAALLAERVRDVLAVPYLIDGHQIDITTSVGISIAPNDSAESEVLLGNAGIALRRAKEDGRDMSHFFEGSFEALILAKRATEADLRSGLARGEFELHFQPILDLVSNEIRAFEALLRWHHPEKGMLLPDAFVPSAVSCGIMGRIGRWVAREACATAATWPDDLHVVVNVSRAELLEREFVAGIMDALSAARLSPDRLEIDVPEGAVADSDSAILNVLSELRDLGIRIALDEFGAGHAPLTYLQSFPFDKIKIGYASRTPGRHQEPMLLLHAVASLAEGVRAETTAKHVETLDQLEAVKARRYTEAQGFLIGPAIPAQDVEAFLSDFDARALYVAERVA